MFRRDNSIKSILKTFDFLDSFNTSQFSEIFPSLLSTYGDRNIQVVLMPGDVKDKWEHSDVEKLIENNLKVGLN